MNARPGLRATGWAAMAAAVARQVDTDGAGVAARETPSWHAVVPDLDLHLVLHPKGMRPL